VTGTAPRDPDGGSTADDLPPGVVTLGQVLDWWLPVLLERPPSDLTAAVAPAGDEDLV
jgi:hypothetical protein